MTPADLPFRPQTKKRQTRPGHVDAVVWERMWAACGRKLLFWTMQDAEASDAAKTWDQVPYLCPTGDHHWHLTKRRDHA